MSVSVTQPITPAIKRTKLVLFQPFDFGKWLRLGFCAFLASLGEGGGSGNGSGGNGGGGGGQQGGGQAGGGNDFDTSSVEDFLREYAVIIVVAVVAVVVLGIALGLLLQWLSSRGKFMFLDGIVKNRGAVVAPWREYREAGNSLFWFRFVLGMVGFVVVLVVAGGCLLLAWGDIQARQFGTMAVTAIVIGVVTMIVFALVMAIIGVFLDDFVVPIMYLRRIRVMEAWRVFRHDILDGHVGVLALYLLFKFLIGIVVGIIATMAVCLTCCLAALPYVGSVVLLPLSVFVRCYSVYFLQQFGPLWKIIPDDDKPPKPMEPNPVY